MASERIIELKRTAPTGPNVSVRVGESFPITASVLADNVSTCSVALRFDDLALEEVTRHPNPWTFRGPDIQEEVQWEFRGKMVVAETTVRINVTANGLPQLSEFAVEVTQ